MAPATASATTRYLSTGGADAGTCVSSPCRSFNYAYRQASPGDVVQVAGGSYPAQSIPIVSGRAAPAVEFRPASGAQVTLGEFDVFGSHVRVRDIKTGFLDIDAKDGVSTVADVTVINGEGSGMWLQTVRDVLIQGGSYGPQTNNAVVKISANPASYNVTFDRVAFHDALITDPSAHLECIWAGGVQNFTVRNSSFRNCAIMDLFFTTLNGPDPKGVVVENNVFETPKTYGGGDSYYTVNVANWLSKVENFTFRNNTFASDILIQPTTVLNTKVVGNVGPITTCVSGVTYSHNVFTGARCSSSDKQVTNAMSQFVNPAGHDWGLTSGAGGGEAADPADYPLTDAAGLARKGAPDAGAYEYGGVSGTPPDTSPPTAPANLTATGGMEQVGLSWSAASDNVGVTLYNVYRSSSSGFTPSSSNRIAQVSGTSLTDSPLAAGDYYYRVTAEDAAGNSSAASSEAHGISSPEQIPPTVSISAPTAGTTVKGTVPVNATASDNRGVSGVQFRLDGADLGTEDTTAPYGVSWNTAATSNGVHSLTAVARDAAGNRSTSQAVSVMVDNTQPAIDSQPPTPPAGLKAIGGLGLVGLAWKPSSDNVGVAHYNVYRSTSSGFTPSSANRIAQVSSTFFTDLSLLLAGRSYYRVTAQDAAGNVSAPSNVSQAKVSVSSPSGSPAAAAATPQLRLVRTSDGRVCRKNRCRRPARVRVLASNADSLQVSVERRRPDPGLYVISRPLREGLTVLKLSPRRMAPGRYRLSLQAVASSGRRSGQIRKRFTIRARKGARSLRF